MEEVEMQMMLVMVVYNNPGMGGGGLEGGQGDRTGDG